jgi:trimeric autotransporter adhesin
MANTVIQLKYSEITATPASLNVAEPAYSNSSGKLYIGNNNSTPVLIGGKYYVDRVDEATSANTANVIVKRDGSGSFSASVVRADLYGNANSATQLLTARTIGVTGDVDANSVSFDGTQNITLNLELTNTGVGAGTYGGATQIPTFAVDADGRITSAANVAISTTLNIAGDTGTDAVALATDTITFVGGDGITTVAYSANSNVKFDVDNTVVRTTGGTISGDLAITGNLVVSGNTITQDVETIVAQDSLIELAANNAADALDIGFFGSYVSAGTKYTTLFRDASDSGRFKLLTGGTEKPSAGNTVNAQAFSTATLQANITGGTVSGLTAAIAIADGGTNATSFTTGQRVLFDGTRLASQANVTTTVTGALSVANTITSLTTNAYGDITAFTGAAIAIDASQITSGNLAIARGGSNNNGGYTTGGILQFDGSKFVSLANTGTAGTYANASHVPVITTDAYGRVSTVTNTAIAIAASQITSGTLGVARGGTGFSSYTANGVIIGGVTSTSALTSVASSTEGHVLQINASGVPTFAHLNGGFF